MTSADSFSAEQIHAWDEGEPDGTPITLDVHGMTLHTTRENHLGSLAAIAPAEALTELAPEPVNKSFPVYPETINKALLPEGRLRKTGARLMRLACGKPIGYDIRGSLRISPEAQEIIDTISPDDNKSAVSPVLAAWKRKSSTKGPFNAKSRDWDRAMEALAEQRAAE